MSAQFPQYYRPYTSDSDTEGSQTDSDSDTDSLSSTASADTPSDLPNFRALAQGLSFQALAGPDFPTEAMETQYTKYDSSRGFPTAEALVPPTSFETYALTPDLSGVSHAGAAIMFNTQSVNNIVMLDSRDRDRNVFPQPTNLTLRLPREYRAVTEFQLVQIKLLSAFQYFRTQKRNTDISILELNRTYADSNNTQVPAIVKNFIREGSYDITGLLSELTIQLNATPLFYDFPNGFADFAPQFAATGNFALGFNFPGDTYYDSLLDEYIPNPTTALIVSKYFQSQYAGLSSYSTDQIKVAYYYPVVKEILLDQTYEGTPLNLNLSPAVLAYLLPTETVRSRCIYTFQGINDPVVQEVIRLNVSTLDEYRTHHTFRYYLVNKYNVTYETQSNRVVFSCPSLNTSLSNLITYKQAQFFAESLNAAGITNDQYNAFQTSNTLLLAVLNDMFYYIQRYLATSFGVNFNTYTLDYIANSGNVIPIQPATQATGISSNFDLAVLSSTTPPINTNLLSTLRVDAPTYWPRMTALPESTIAYPFNLETGTPATDSNYPYTLLTNERDDDHRFVDASGYIYNNKLLRHADVLVPLDPAKYTVFQFKSPVRQTLQVETLPRPTQFRYPAYNAIAYDASQAELFDNSYAFVQNAQNVKLDITANFSTTSLSSIPGFATLPNTANFGLSYVSSLALWDSATSVASVGTTRLFYEFQAPHPVSPVVDAGTRYPLSLTLDAAVTPAHSTFVAPMNMYLYHDRGAFMADVSDNRNEKPIHYLSTLSVSTNVSSATFTFPVYGGQTYYVLARTQDELTDTQSFRVVPWFPAGSSYTALTSSLTGFDPLADPQTPAALSNFNYAAVADPAYIRLPIQPAIQTSTTTDALYTTLAYSTVAMGYDISGVSTDLTDYCGFTSNVAATNPTAATRIDPINQYIFQNVTGYNSTTQTYLFPGTSNSLFLPGAITVYTPKTVPARQTVMAHWYGNTFIANMQNQQPMLASNLADTSVIQPFSPTTTDAPLSGYLYQGSNSAIQLGDGVVGMSFIPQQGVWDIERMMFKSIYTSSNVASDSNLAIQYVGVFYSAYTKTNFLHEMRLDDALAVLKFSKAMTYTPSTLSLGFDAAGGTYYEFVRDTSFRTGSNSYLYGYSQIRSTINTDINAAYTFLPFDAGKSNLYFQGLVGSPVPYPYYSDAIASPTYNDGSTAPDGKDIIVPQTKGSPDVTRGPPAGYDETQSHYEQSMPIGTNFLNYTEPFPFISSVNAMKPWNPLPYSPSLIIADVSGYIMTQDSYYRVFQYYGDGTSNLNLDERYQFTLDQVYPPTDPRIQFLGVTANENEYAFFAYSNTVPHNPATSKLLIRTMRPADGSIRDTFEYANLPGLDPTVQQVTNVTYNNYGGFTMALDQSGVFTVVSKATSSLSTVTTFSVSDTAGFNSNIDRLMSRQAPREPAGAYYVFPYRTGLGGPVTEGVTDYIMVTPSNAATPPVNPYNYAALAGPQDTWPTGNSNCQIEVFNLSNGLGADVYKQPIIARNPWREYVYMLSDTDANRIYEVTGYTASNQTYFTSNALTTPSVYSFPSPASNLTQGAAASKWSLFGSTIYGNRDNAVDAPKRIYAAWQLFYPVQRVVFKQIAKTFTFLHDLSGLQYPEYPHTALVGYSSITGLAADTTARWGLESASNFAVADFAFSGQTFGSYLFTFPLKPTTPSSPYYYLAVRNYSPTEKSQVLMRVSAPNLYDFGYVSMTDISNEIQYTSTMSNMFNPDYYAALAQFNSNFIIGSNGRVFGSNIVNGYNGSNISNVTGFGDFYNRFVTLYNQYNIQVQTIQTINSNTNAATSNFIQTELQNIIPSSALNRQRFTDPLTFSILWRSALAPQMVPLVDNWGLGWNLGFDKVDTPYETVQKAQSFYKILEDYILLRMNQEFDMNRMDTGAKEVLSATLEPTGATKAFHAKLLLANFGNFAQTIITNPISFTPPLGRLDKLTFQWVDTTGTIIDNSDCEWNVVLQVAEKRDVTSLADPVLMDPSAGRGVPMAAAPAAAAPAAPAT